MLVENPNKMSFINMVNGVADIYDGCKCYLMKMSVDTEDMGQDV